MAAPNRYDVGDRVRLRATFRTLDGTETDPTSIVCKHKDPSGNITTITYPTSIVKEGTGRYYLDLDIDEEGEWSYRWAGTGAVVAAGETTLIARDSAF